MNIPILSNLLEGLNRDRREYVRYIIVGNPRTGSNMLRGLLNGNKYVVAFGELFRFNDAIGWDYPGYDPKAEADLLLINKNPVRFLRKKVFVNFPAPVQAVGFKIFYFHAQSENWKPVWSYLREQKDIKVIHIKRNNVLKTYLSHTRALATDKWLNSSGREENQPPIPLEYRKCLHYLKKVKENEEKYDDFFKNHHTLELIYEDLAASYKSELKRVTDFLGIPFKESQPVTFPQSRKPLPEIIVNYRELKEKFRSTPWEQYFED